MKRDDLLFGTGALSALMIVFILEFVTFPWWVSLLLVPPAIWYVVRIALGWRDEWRKKDLR